MSQEHDRERPRASWKRRRLLGALAVGGLIVLGFARPGFRLIRTAWQDVDDRVATALGSIDDASRLNETAVAEVYRAPADRREAERELARLLARARRRGLTVSIGGSRHSMGGQSIAAGGIVVDMRPLKWMSFDEQSEILTVGAGATWKDVIAFLDAVGRSVGVMQSNNSFTVGGSISVNCHGWQYNRPPIASTVQSLRLMQADGRVVRCSREENSELFSLVLGGYGLFGIVLDVELRSVPNQAYRLDQQLVPSAAAMETFDQITSRGQVEMIYARLCTAHDRLFDEVLINALSPTPGPPPELDAPGIAAVRRAVFRGSAEDDYGKKLRWFAETKLQPHLSGKVVSRNQLLNEGVEVFENRSATTTDVLHEYFVPPARTAEFVARMRGIVLEEEPNLLNVTVRIVNEDRDSFLRYADARMIAFVMLLMQERSLAGEEKMERLSRRLIDAALECGGRYYLPYRLHASQEQFAKAYPQGEEFFALKRRYDPQGRFGNEFYARYGAAQKNRGASPAVR